MMYRPIIELKNHLSNPSSVLLPASSYLFEPIQPIGCFIESSSSSLNLVDDNIMMESTTYEEKNCYTSQTDNNNDVLLNLPIIDLQIEECNDNSSALLDHCYWMNNNDHVNRNVNDDDVNTSKDDDDESDIDEEMNQIYHRDFDEESFVDDDWANHIADVDDNVHNVPSNNLTDIFMSSLCSITFGMSYRNNIEEDNNIRMIDYDYNYDDDIDSIYEVDYSDAVVIETTTNATNTNATKLSQQTIASPTCVGIETQDMYDEINKQRHQLWKQSLKTSLFHKSSSIV